MVMQQSCKQQKATDACPMQNNKSHLCCPYLDRFSLHAHRQTFLVSAILAAVPLSLVNRTASFFSTCICEVFTHCTFEEPFATFTTAICKDPLLTTRSENQYQHTGITLKPQNRYKINISKLINLLIAHKSHSNLEKQWNVMLWLIKQQ